MLSTYASFRGIEVHYTRSRRTYTWLTSNALSITLADLTAFLNNSFQFVILDQSVRSLYFLKSVFISSEKTTLNVRLISGLIPRSQI